MKTQKMKTERRPSAPKNDSEQHLQMAGSLDTNSAKAKSGTKDFGRSRTAVSHDKNIEPTWVKESSKLARDYKRAIAMYAATHLIGYGDVIQVGSGTTFNALMDKIIEQQLESKNALDLIVLTSNLQVLAKGRNAQSIDQSIFGTMQIILTGGALQMSLDSLIGEFAAKGVNTEFIFPRTTFFGASGLSFHDELTIRYQFEEEISTQVAYATRPTGRRVLLCDHTKLGKKTGWKAGLSVEKLLSSTDQCFIISTLPDDDSENSAQEKRIVEQEVMALEKLLNELLERDKKNKIYADKEFALRLVDLKGVVKREISLSRLRNEIKSNG